MSASEFRLLLEAGDVEGCRRYWHKHAPGMPQPETREQAEISMHMARTAAHSVKLQLRAYSHRWLLERAMPSQLPEMLKPIAERMCPVIVEAVGVSVNFTSPILAPAAAEVQGAMNAVVEDCFANGDRDPALIKGRMFEAKDRTMKALFGQGRA